MNPYLSSGFVKVNAWDFPLLLKYRFRVGGLHPFVSGGYQCSRQAREYSSLMQCLGPAGSCRPVNYPGQDFPNGSAGRYTEAVRHAVTGAGLEFKTKHVTITPEVRVGHGVTGMVGFTFGK